MTNFLYKNYKTISTFLLFAGMFLIAGIANGQVAMPITVDPSGNPSTFEAPFDLNVGNTGTGATVKFVYESSTTYPTQTGGGDNNLSCFSGATLSACIQTYWSTSDHITFTRNLSSYSDGYFWVEIKAPNHPSGPIDLVGEVYINTGGVWTYTGVGSGITNINSPTGTGLGTNVVFDFDYNNADAYDRAVVELNNLTLQYTTTPITEIPLINGSGLNWSFSVNVQAGSSYQYRIRLWDSINNLYTDWSSIETFSTTGTAPTLPIPDTDIVTNCNFSNVIVEYICEGVVYLFYPSQDYVNNFLNLETLLTEKVPFGFFFIIKTKFDTLTSATSSPMADIVVNLGTGSIGSINMLDFSEIKTDVDYLFQDAIPFLIWALWIVFGIYIFYRVNSIL